MTTQCEQVKFLTPEERRVMWNARLEGCPSCSEPPIMPLCPNPAVTQLEGLWCCDEHRDFLQGLRETSLVLTRDRVNYIPGGVDINQYPLSKCVMCARETRFTRARIPLCKSHSYAEWVAFHHTPLPCLRPIPPKDKK